MLSAIILLVTGCSKYTGGLEHSSLAKETASLREDLTPGSGASTRGDTTFVSGYVVDHVEEESGCWTIMALGRPGYSSGSYGTPGTPGHYNPTTGGMTGGSPGSPPENASVNIRKSPILYAVPGRIVKREGIFGSALYVFRTSLTDELIEYKSNDVMITVPVPSAQVNAAPAELLRGLGLAPRIGISGSAEVTGPEESSSGLDVAPHLGMSHFPEAAKPEGSYFPEIGRQDWELGRPPSMLPPELPEHLRNLDGRVFFVCQKSYDLGRPFASVPLNLRLNFDHKGTSKVYGKLAGKDPEEGYHMTGSDAERVKDWARALGKVDKAADFILGKKTPFFIAIDQRGLLQEKRDTKALGLLQDAVKSDSEWDLPYGLLTMTYRELGLDREADEVSRAALDAAVLDSVSRQSFADGLPEGLPWLHDPFKTRHSEPRNRRILGRRWRVGGVLRAGPGYRGDSPELVGTGSLTGNHNVTPGLSSTIRLSHDLLVEATWSPFRYGNEMTGAIEITDGFDNWKMDRFSIRGIYQTPVRVQLWKWGCRAHLAAGTTRFHESFDIDNFHEGDRLEAEVQGWTYDAGIGLSSRRSFSELSDHFAYVEFGYRFAGSREFDTTLGGVDAVVISTLNQKPLSLNPSGWHFSVGYMF